MIANPARRRIRGNPNVLQKFCKVLCNIIFGLYGCQKSPITPPIHPELDDSTGKSTTPLYIYSLNIREHDASW